MDDDPLILAVKISMENHYHARAYIEKLLHNLNSHMDEGVKEMKENISNSTSSQHIIYKQINPTLSVHSVYKTSTHINKHH